MVFNEIDHTLSYIPREGETLNTADIVLPRIEQLVILRGDQGKAVENICFDGLTFSHSRFDVPPHGYAGIQACFHERRLQSGDSQDVPITAAVLVDNARECSFTNCRFQHLAGCGLRIEHASGCRVENSIFRDIGGNGVMIGSIRQPDAP